MITYVTQSRILKLFQLFTISETGTEERSGKQELYKNGWCTSQTTFPVDERVSMVKYTKTGNVEVSKAGIRIRGHREDKQKWTITISMSSMV